MAKDIVLRLSCDLEQTKFDFQDCETENDVMDTLIYELDNINQQVGNGLRVIESKVVESDASLSSDITANSRAEVLLSNMLYVILDCADNYNLVDDSDNVLVDNSDNIISFLKQEIGMTVDEIKTLTYIRENNLEVAE